MKPQPQVRDTAILKKATWGGRVLWWGKLAILIISAVWISTLVANRIPEIVTIGNSLISGWSLYFLLAILLLFPLNIYLETVKWTTLLGRKVNSWLGLKSILAGMSLGLITPTGVGEAIGRVSYLKGVSPRTSLPAVILNSLIQTIITLVFGVVGISAMVNSKLLSSEFAWMVLVGGLGLMALVVIFFLGIGSFGKVKSLWRICKKYSVSTIARTFGLGTIRYFVFSAQYALAIFAFGINLDLEQVLVGITWVFLAKTVVPTFSRLGDLGVREMSALLYFQALGVEPAMIVLASLTIWVINNLVPSIVGVLALIPLNPRQGA